MANQVKSSTGAIQDAVPAVPSLSDAREAARRCVKLVIDLLKVADWDFSFRGKWVEMQRAVRDPNAYATHLSEAMEIAWQPIYRFWPEVLDAYGAFVFDGTMSFPIAPFPAPVQAWLLAQRALAHIAISSRLLQVAPGLVELECSMEQASEAAKGILARHKPTSDSDVRRHHRYMFNNSLGEGEFCPLVDLNELLARIETTAPTASVLGDPAIDLPLSPDSVLEARRVSHEQAQLKVLADDLKTHVAVLRVQLAHQQDVLSYAHDAYDAYRALNRRRAEVDVESILDLRSKMTAALLSAIQVLDGPLLRPPVSGILLMDRTELAKRILRYALVRWELCEEIKCVEIDFEILESKDRAEVSTEIVESAAELDTAGSLIVKFYESALEQWLSRLPDHSGSLEWRTGFLGLEFHDGGKIVRRAGKEVYLAKTRLGWGILNKLERSQQSRITIHGLTAIWNDVGRTDVPDDHTVVTAVYDLNKRIKPLGIQADNATGYGYTLIEVALPPGPTTAPQEQVKETPQSKQAKPVKKAARSAHRNPKGS